MRGIESCSICRRKEEEEDAYSRWVDRIDNTQVVDGLCTVVDLEIGR